jgi:RNA polymerase sigma-70 factor (ECF subfamily)
MDLECARKAMAGDSAAFEQLIVAEEPYLRALAMSQLSDQEAMQDAVQEALLLAWKNIGTLRQPGALKGWLGSIVIRTCYNYRRKRRRDRIIPLETVLQFEPIALEQDSPESSEQGEGRVSTGIRALDEESQKILAMKYSQSLDCRTIAAQLGVSEEAVRGRLFRAREKLRGQLRRLDKEERGT